MMPKETNTMGRDMENRAKWEKTNLRSYNFKLHRVNDEDVIRHLEKIPNKRDYIIGLIRDDMKK